MTDDLEICLIMPFGKHQGKQVENVPPSYLMWLYENTELRGHPDLLDWIEDHLEDLEADSNQEPYCDDSYWDNRDE